MSHRVSATLFVLANIVICIGVFLIWYNPFVGLGLCGLGFVLGGVSMLVPEKYVARDYGTWRTCDEEV
jgi:hypothetical protein